MTLQALIHSLPAHMTEPPEAVKARFATHRGHGVLMEDPQQVWLRAIATIDVDEAGSGLDAIPASLASGRPKVPTPVPIAALQAYTAAHPHLAGLEVFLADGVGETGDGQPFSMNVAVLDGRQPGAEACLLQASEDQWPSVWFDHSAGMP